MSFEISLTNTGNIQHVWSCHAHMCGHVMHLSTIQIVLGNVVMETRILYVHVTSCSQCGVNLYITL